MGAFRESGRSTYLTDKGGLLPHIIASAEITAQADHGEEGVMIVVRHLPLEKFRLLLPLSEPVTVTTLVPASYNASIAAYARKVRGLAKMIGVLADEACFDVSRVFYMPSHPPGAEYGLDVIRVRGLTIEELPEVEKAGRKNPFETAGTNTDAHMIGSM